VLKGRGRVTVSDIALLKRLPDEIKESVTALIGCIGGAVLIDETREMIAAAGLIEEAFEQKNDYIDNMSEWSDPLYLQIAAKLPPGAKPSDYVTSLSITARKPE